jgi:hypothetical protein
MYLTFLVQDFSLEAAVPLHKYILHEEFPLEFDKKQFLDAVFLSLTYLKLFLRKFELAGFCDRIYT